jgi:hypothetical protein
VVCRGFTIGALALLLAAPGCHKSDVGVDVDAECTPPPANLACPDAGPPSFADVLENVFLPVCQNCHAPGPGKTAANIPFTNYQQIYGPTSGPNMGQEARAIHTQVFENCYMPPPGDASVAFDNGRRQLLLDWFACGALDSPTIDAGASD